MPPHPFVLINSSLTILLVGAIMAANFAACQVQPTLRPPATGQPQSADDEPAIPGMIGTGGKANCNGVTPCACALLGDVGLTTVNGTNAANLFLPVGENIYGPFEAGFGSQQDNILGKLGCATGKGYVAGGIDTKTAEAVVAKDCGIVLPRTSPTNTYISLLDKCGGHTTAYHFHERLSCLYKLEGTHSTKVGEDVEFKKGIYGKWEDYSTKTLPTLDACGGHFGYTPESPTTKVYHYHLQDEAPFTLGCFGPNAQNQEVTMAECRALYAGCNTASGIIDVFTYNGTSQYQTWCPCFFTGVGGNNSNVLASIAVPAATPAPMTVTPQPVAIATPQPTSAPTQQPAVTTTTPEPQPAVTTAAASPQPPSSTVATVTTTTTTTTASTATPAPTTGVVGTTTSVVPATTSQPTTAALTTTFAPDVIATTPTLQPATVQSTTTVTSSTTTTTTAASALTTFAPDSIPTTTPSQSTTMKPTLWSSTTAVGVTTTNINSGSNNTGAAVAVAAAASDDAAAATIPAWGAVCIALSVVLVIVALALLTRYCVQLRGARKQEGEIGSTTDDGTQGSEMDFKEMPLLSTAPEVCK